MHGIEYTKHGLKRLLNSHDYLLIVDVEHTCDIHEHIPPSEREIIELGAVVVYTQSLLVIDEFQCLVKPIVHPILSNFCVELTGIKQVEIESSDEFPVVFKHFLSWQAKYCNLLVCSWGAYDRVQLNIDCERHGLQNYNVSKMLNVKKAFAKLMKIKPQVGMKRAMNLVGLESKGEHHRALNDARNIAQLLNYLCIQK